VPGRIPCPASPRGSYAAGHHVHRIHACSEVGRTADRLGSMLAAVHGGRVAFPDAAEVGYEHED
jgi:hypothetical protein